MYIVIIFLSFSFGRMAQLVAHSLRKQEVPGSVQGTALHRVFFLLVYDDILLSCDFCISFQLLFKVVFRMEVN